MGRVIKPLVAADKKLHVLDSPNHFEGGGTFADLRIRQGTCEFQIHMPYLRLHTHYIPTISVSQFGIMHVSQISKLGYLSSIAFILLLMAPMVVRASTVGGTGSSVTPVSDPPLNPNALFAVSGSYAYAAAGTAMRDQGYGTINETWTGTLFAAYLIWGVINDTNSDINQGTLNGHLITGTLQSYDMSPCWGYGNLWVFATDVTSLVVNGSNSLRGFASGVTTGEDPWGPSSYVEPLDEGATLVVISTGATPNQIYIYTGAYTEPSAGNPLTSVFNHGAADATNAQTTFIVSDGQLPGNYAEFNGVTIDSNAFPGSDPRTSTATWSYGNMWDTKTYPVSVTLGSTSESASIGASGGDCLTWAGQVISIPSTAPITPPTGVPEFGMPMLVVAISMVGFAFLAKRKSSLSSEVP